MNTMQLAHNASNENAKPRRETVKSPELRGAELSAAFRADIKAAVKTGTLPKGKYSVRQLHYGSYKIEITLPVPMINREFHSLETYQNHTYLAYDRERGNWDMRADGTGSWKVDANRYTPVAAKALADVKAMVLEYHWDESDLMTDYHNSRFYYDIELDTTEEESAIVAELIAARDAAAAAAVIEAEMVVAAETRGPAVLPVATPAEEATAAEPTPEELGAKVRDAAAKMVDLASTAIFAHPKAPMGTSADSRYNDAADLAAKGEHRYAIIAAMDAVAYATGLFAPEYRAACELALTVENLLPLNEREIHTLREIAGH